MSEQQTLCMVREHVFVYDAPDKKTKIGEMVKNKHYPIHARNNQWICINYNGRDGYVFFDPNVKVGPFPEMMEAAANDSKVVTGTATQQHETHLDRILRVGRLVGVYLLPVALVVGFVVWLLVGGMAVYHLGWFHFALEEPTPTLTSVAVTVTALMLAAYLAATGRLQKNVSRSVALAAFIGWLAILALLALLDMGLTSGALRFSQEATGDAWRINIPPELLEISKFIYALVAALPLIVFLILWATHSSEQAGKYNTLSHGAKASGLFFLKLSLAVAMFSFEAFFGLYAGYSPVMAIPAALLNAVVFTVALNEVQAAVNDGRSAKLWGSIAIFYSALMFAIAYEVGIQFGGDAFQYAPKPTWLRVFAETGFLSSIGLSAIVLALAKLSPLWSNREHKDEPIHERAANYVVSVKDSARKALGKTDDKPATGKPQLPAGITLADDGMTEAEARKLVEGALKPDRELMVSGKKVSKNGTIYDETGVEVSPAEAADLMRRHREMLDREAQRPK